MSSIRGTTLIASIASAGFSLGIAEVADEHATLSASLRTDLPMAQRTNAQAAALLKQHLQEQGEGFLKDYAKQHGHKRIRNIYAVLQAPMSNAAVISTRKVLERESRITDALLDECARDAIGTMTERSDFLGARLLQVRLNGYPTTKPEGKYAQEVEIEGLATTLDPQVKEPILASLQALSPSAHLQVRSGTLAIAQRSLQAAKKATICSSYA
jgi:hypothetical protein